MSLPKLFDLTQQESIPEAGIAGAVALMRSGKLHRYGETGAAPSEASSLELEFAQEMGAKYCIALNSCGSAMFVALKAAGVKPGDAVLTNCFTLAPVPGAIAHATATPVLVDVTDDYLIDMDDLEKKAQTTGARTLLLSHMRGHICDMDRLTRVCARHSIQVIEDCAHTMGASWRNKATGTWGKAGCFSLQSYKHANSGEGGLLITSDDDLAAQAILMSGSYMLYKTHLARPADEVFERWKFLTPNFSMRMSNLAAIIARPQLGAALRERCQRWNERYNWMVQALEGIEQVRIPQRHPDERFVASSIQFSTRNLATPEIRAFIAHAAAQGVHIKWFGAAEPLGFTSVWQHWQYFGKAQELPNAQRVLGELCDMRLPLSLTRENCQWIGNVIGQAMQSACVRSTA